MTNDELENAVRESLRNSLTENDTRYIASGGILSLPLQSPKLVEFVTRSEDGSTLKALCEVFDAVGADLGLIIQYHFYPTNRRVNVLEISKRPDRNDYVEIAKGPQAPVKVMAMAAGAGRRY